GEKIEQLKENDNKQTKQIQQLNEEITQLKLENEKMKIEKELNEKKISTIHNGNLILRQQLDTLLTEFEKWKKKMELKPDEIIKLQDNNNEDRKEYDDDNKLLQSKSSKHSIFNFDMFHSSSNILKTLTGHTSTVWSIDYSIFDNCEFICSGSRDNTIRIWDINSNKQIQLSKVHSSAAQCAKFSLYHRNNLFLHIICSCDKTIRFWDIKDTQQLQILEGHTDSICSIEFSPFSGGRYLCSGSNDKTIRLWDVETSSSLYVFNEHKYAVRCVNISPLQSCADNTSNSIGIIGGNGYTICSGSRDKNICIWDIETTKQLNVFEGHEREVKSVKYGSNELRNIGGSNTILSGSCDKSVRLWDIQSGQQIQTFKGHTNTVTCVEYFPLVSNNEISASSNVVCSASEDNTIRFWDIRSNKKELYVIKGDENDNGIFCLKFIPLKKQKKEIRNNNNNCNVNLYYGSNKGHIRVWG
ncbi:WD-40 repeat protein, partial [Reticulomyxa filosa]